MKSLLAKIAFHKAVGLYLGDHEVAVSQVAATPLGPVETASVSEPCTPETMQSVLDRLAKPLLGGKHRLPAAVGIPSFRVFFGTRLARADGEVTAASVLQKVFTASNLRVDDLTADLVKREVNKMQVASVAACRKKYMGGTISLLTQLGVRPAYAEPEACAMVRLAMHQNRFPRRSKLVMCVFLNATHGLAAIVVGGLPLAWRQFTVTDGSEGQAILSAVRTLQTQQKHYGIETPPDYVMIFGCESLHERLRKEQLPSELGSRVTWHAGPELSARSTAYGLALGCVTPTVQGFDLARDMKPRPSIAEIFPWGELAFVIICIMGMVLALGFHLMNLNDSYSRVQLECTQHPCLLGGKSSNLEKDKKLMENRIEAVRRFLDTRTLWTSYVSDISRRLPATARLMSFQGASELTDGKKAVDGKKTLLLLATAPVSGEGVVPREIDAFLDELRKSDVLKRDFASVELTTMRQASSPRMQGQESQSEASFTIVCLPKAKGRAKPAEK